MYQYVAADTRTGAIRGGLDLTGLSWERGVLATGGCTATLNLSDITDHPEVALLEQEYTAPYRNTIVPLRDGGAVCEYLWLPRKVTQTGEVVSLTGVRLWSIVRNSRYITADFDFDQVDVATIIETLFRHSLDRPGGELGEVEIDCPPTGVTRTISYRAADHTKAGEAIEALCDGVCEFDLTTRLDSNDRLVRSFRLFTPQQGELNPMLHFALPDGPGAEWELTETDIENVVTVTGKDGLTATVERTDLLDNGWPRIESVTQAQDLPEQTMVDTLAEGRARIVGAPADSFTMTLREFTGWEPGESGLLELGRSRWFQSGHEAVVRVVDTKVDVDDEGNESVAAAFADRLALLPPSSPDDWTAATLAQFDRRLRDAGI